MLNAAEYAPLRLKGNEASAQHYNVLSTSRLPSRIDPAGRPNTQMRLEHG